MTATVKPQAIENRLMRPGVTLIDASLRLLARCFKTQMYNCTSPKNSDPGGIDDGPAVYRLAAAR